MTVQLDGLGFKVAIAEAIELADPIGIATHQAETQQAIIKACGAYGPHAFAIAAVSALASVFASYPGSYQHCTHAITNVIAAMTLEASQIE